MELNFLFLSINYGRGLIQTEQVYGLVKNNFLTEQYRKIT